MFSRQRAWDIRKSYSSRYSYMIDTKDPIDVANAESCRLASQAWQDIAMFCQNPNLEDEHGNPAEYDVEVTIQELRDRWDNYCRTGVALNDVDELARDIRKAHAKKMELRSQNLATNTPNSPQHAPSSIPEPKTPQTSSQKRKDRQKPAETPYTVSAKPSAISNAESQEEVEKIDENNRALIQTNAIEMIIDEIRLELGIGRALQELATK
jgi:hypothetical protein